MPETGDLERKWQRALSFHKGGNLAAAEPLYREVLAARPDLAQGWNLLGMACAQLGRAAEGLDAFERALALKPDLAEALTGRAKLLLSLGRIEEAVTAHDRALEASPWDAEAWNRRGGALSALGRDDEAMQSFRQAVAIRPDCWEAWNNRGILAQHRKLHAEALESFEQVLALNPGMTEALRSRAIALSGLGCFTEALAGMDKAIEKKPDDAENHRHRAGILAELGRFEEALQAYDRALALKPDDAEAHYRQGLLYLLMGRFALGWRQYEWRKRRGTKPARRVHAEPHWLGEEDISGKTLLLSCEQKLGDTIQFSRLAPMAAARGAQVFLSVQAPLLRLLAGLDERVRVIGPHAAPARFDYQASLMSLPLAFGLDAEIIPGAPYLKADPELLQEWSARLGARTRPRIGLAWSDATGDRDEDDPDRSIPLAHFLPLLGQEAEWFSLQKDDPAGGEEWSGLVSFGDKLRDFADTAALIEQMDLVISADNDVGHLAGALGKPLWLLLPFKPDWRWQLNREDSPWYGSARLFRQEKRDDWEPVFEKLKRELAALLTARCGNSP
ncbi:MAG TPA: tetratricopeptide repeat protein [Rhizomicrobium sp.]|nr:tetratricopeptide repeat protein [Rhizomicrobium sp.]